MIKKVVFFLASPLDNRDYKRFGGDILKANGFEVAFWDFSSLIFPALYKYGKKKGRSDKGVLFDNETDAIEAILKLSEECFVVSITVAYGQRTFRLFRALSRTKAHYAISVTNAMPNVAYRRRGKTDLLMKRISEVTLPKLINYFNAKYRFNPSWAKYRGIRPPALLFAGGMRSLEHDHASIIDKNTEILWLHTLDYDIYLDTINKRDIEKKKSGKAVYLDIPSPRFKRDALAFEKKSVLTEERYYPSLCNLFDLIEDKFGLKVEIAAHPGSDHEMYPDYFGKRLTVSGKTCEMVMESEVVISPGSTAMNFAILFNKPVIHITSDEYETSYRISDAHRSMAASIGKKPVNIDHLTEVDWDRELSIDKDVYCKYINDYIKKPGSEDFISWQIVANRLKDI